MHAIIRIIQDGVVAGTGQLVQDQHAAAYIDDCPAILGPADLDHESGEQQDYSERVYQAIEDAIEHGLDRVELDGITYTWEIEPEPAIEVIGIGDDDWTDDDDRPWHRYGQIRVRIGEVEYQVGAAIGVPPHLRAIAEAAGGNITRPAYLYAWYVDPSDWASAPASDGTTGIPRRRHTEVLSEIHREVARLWQEYEAQASA